MKTSRLILCSMILSFCFGCTHSLEIRNLHQYTASSYTSFPKDVRLGISSPNTEMNGKALVMGVASALGRYKSEVVYPYYPSNSRKVDFISNIVVRPDHRGSGVNFLIEWPGFLIWTPAWNGYVYHPSYTVDVELIRGSDNKTLDRFTIPIDLDVRHADYNRTWTEISWLEVSAIAFFSGFVFIQYDDKVTPLLEREIKGPVGEYIAQEIARRIMRSDFFEGEGQGKVL